MFVKNPQDWAFSVLSPDAAMDWFGRSLCGHVAIGNFFRARTSNLTIDQVVKIPPISHRLLSQASSTHSETKAPVEECGQGDCGEKLSTPENSIQVDFQELLKAPRVKRCRPSLQQDMQFVEIKGKLEMRQSDDDHPTEKNINRIVLGFTNQINLIVFEGKKSCRKLLFPV